MDTKRKYILASLIPVIILLGMCVKPVTTLLFGQEVLLKTAPFDPRDLFRGDHVILNYQISNIPVAMLPFEIEEEKYSFRTKDVYVVLKKTGDYYDLDAVKLSKPDAGPYLKGKIKYFSTNETGQEVAHIDYSLDKFFVPEKTGSELEEKSRQGDLTARVKIFNGYAYLISIE
ncbi:MAG: GDYXXLXY domain-containing protein [Bacillota bacterium]|nr:GDYXXLXY domain-containing protein [Bacillota bacterium]